MKKRRTFIVVVLLIIFVLTGCQRFNDDFVPSEYSYNDVYYKIHNSKDIRFKVVINEVFKEQGKEDIYSLGFSGMEEYEGGWTVPDFFELELSETDYKNKIGNENNVITCNYSELWLSVPCKDSKEFDCILYYTESKTYSIEDNYILYDKTNINGAIEQFLSDIVLTQNIQLIETGTEKTHHYLVGVYQLFENNIFDYFTKSVNYCNTWGPERLDEKLEYFTKYTNK